MKTNSNLLAIFVVIIACSVVVWLSATLQGDQKTYEIEPHLAIPEYKTDLTRVMDAYERLMERYLDLTERNQSMVGADLKYVVTTLDSIDGRLTEMSARIARIETALGVEQPRSSLSPKPTPQP
jgi:Na+/phosphate symporter